MFQRTEVFGLVFWLPFACARLAAQPSQTSNAWNSPASGSWEDMHWSLGQLPAQGQSVLLTNAGWKAVAIGPGTVANFPQSLNPSIISLSAPADSYNLLLLNYFGFATPLTTTQLTIGSNTTLTALSSALNVNDASGGLVSVGGTLNQGEFATVTAGRLNIGDVGPGMYYMTNGTLLVTVTQAVGGNFSAVFNQFAGTNYSENLLLQSGGEYDLVGGALSTRAIVYRAGGTFRQLGGVVQPDRMYVSLGGYFLSAGIFSSGDIELPGATSYMEQEQPSGASFVQTGGTNQSSLLNIGTWHPAYFNGSSSGAYTLSNGVLVTITDSLGPWGHFNQWGGSHTAGGIAMNGQETYIGVVTSPAYGLYGGTLSSSGISMTMASFYQNGGTNQVAGTLNLSYWGPYGSTYDLSGGLLTTSNTTMVGSIYSRSGFNQSGGVQIVSNLLTVSHFGTSSPNYSNPFSLGFVLNGGQLIAQNIQVDSGATFHHRGGTLINTGMVILADGIWEANTNLQQLGQLMLGAGTNSAIYLPAGAATLRFAASSGLVWSNDATVTIEYWNGSVTGGGMHQVYIGTNVTGVSTVQLSQIRFEDPAGASGTYPATMLPSGEIVPARFLASRNTGSGLQLSWAPGMVLQSSTNVTGPYTDVKGAGNPYTAPLDQPSVFFRLRY